MRSLKIEGMTEALNEKIVNAVESIEGDYEKRLALESIVEEELSTQAWKDVIRHARNIGGDREKRLILDEIRDQLPDNKELIAAWTEAAESISGKRERTLLLGKDN